MPFLLSAVIVLTAALQTTPLFPPITVHGHVYEPNGRPGAYALVSAIELGWSNSGPVPFTHSDRAGNFVLRLPAYGHYEITAEQAKHGFFIDSQARAQATVDVRYGEIRPETNLRLRGK
jgi:hypothetical protein